MRLFQAPSTLLYTIGLLSFSTSTHATPFWWPRSLQAQESTGEAESSHNATLELRACANPCGWYGQLCCQTGQSCYTDSNNQAQCGGTGTAAATAAGGYWQYYTTTYVETGYVTRTTVISSYIPAQTVTAAAAATTATCNYALNQSPCGSICCASGQYCVTPGQCAAAGGGSSEGYASSYTAPASAPLRPTTGTTVLVTSTSSPTTTLPFATPVATGANITLVGAQPEHSHLSGGAIAGIVIGVLLGIALLFLLCFCFCASALLNLLKGIFGGGRRKRTTETEYIEEYHHSSGGGLAAGGAAAASGGRRWHGDRPSRPEKPPKKSGLGGMGAMAAGLGALAVGLGLKRKYDKKNKTDYTGSSYDYSYYGSSMSGSSSEDRRTRRSSRH